MKDDMTDIVERARITANCGIPDFTNSKLLDALADEIERLRAALERIAEFCSGDAQALGAIERVAEIQHIAREALTGREADPT
jgi:hypothetical protein